MRRFGELDVVVNNAGVMVFKRITEHTGEDFLKVLNVDLLGAFYFTKQAFLKMKKGGVIVNVSSVHAVETTPHVASYAAANPKTSPPRSLTWHPMTRNLWMEPRCGWTEVA